MQNKPLSRATTVAPAIDPGSDTVLLTFADGPLGTAVPGRDLHGGDLARIARVRALTASGGEPVEPPTQEQLAALYLELVASGTFTPATAPEPRGWPRCPPRSRFRSGSRGPRPRRPRRPRRH